MLADSITLDAVDGTDVVYKLIRVLRMGRLGLTSPQTSRLLL